MSTSVFVKRPVAFRVPRVVDDKLSATEWRYFTDEEAAYKEAEALGVDYQGLFVRDGTAIVKDARDVVEQCAAYIDAMADKQEHTNRVYPDHAKAYPSWVDRIPMYRLLASELRARLGRTQL